MSNFADIVYLRKENGVRSQHLT